MSSQTQDLTVRVSAQVKGDGLKQLADQSKKIASETQGALDRIGKNDPFSRLARGGEVTDRLNKITNSLRKVGSGFALVEEQAKGFFGISGQAKSVERSLSLVRDRVDSIRVSASKMRFDADVTPLFAKLRRADGEVRKIRSAASGMMTAGLGNFSGAGSFGLMDVQDQRRALDIGQQMARGDSISREDMEFAHGIEQLSPLLSNLGRRQAASNGFAAELEKLAGPGDLSRNETIRQADILAQRNEAIAVKIENQLQVQATVNVESMARDLTRDLRPAIEEVQKAIRDSMMNTLREMARQIDERNRQQQGAQNAGNQQ